MVRLSGGRVGWRLVGAPALELTTIGRKSGQLHKVMLISPITQGDAFVIVASRGGDDHHPSWFFNLLDHPEVMVTTRQGVNRSMKARVVSETEREELWARITATVPRYAAYQRKTKRTIPVLLLEPLGVTA